MHALVMQQRKWHHKSLMKIIFSRKGFDACIGTVASPIFPSDEMCTLPIPESPTRACSIHYKDIHFGEHSLAELVGDLARGKIAPDRSAHLDPDLNRESLPRLPGWKPLFGQAGAAERHLQNVGVQPGDLFLFYGWFRRVGLRDGAYRYVKDAPDLHVIFGWLQIEQRIKLEASVPIEEWMRYHPHCQKRLVQDDPGAITGAGGGHNSLYIATDHLRLPGMSRDIPGAGIFLHYHPSLRLTNTDPYCSRRVWRVPEWMHPTSEKAALTYHRNLSVWQRRDGYSLLRSAGRGQEFVLDCDDYPQAVEWAAELLSHAGKSSIID